MSTSNDITILRNQPPLEHEHFAAHRELEARLRARLRGEVRFDTASRALYAADSSNYRQVPVGVITPADAGDVEVAIELCREYGAAILPRGAGTSLAGQTTNVAVIFDFSRHMKGLIRLDPEHRLAVVEPGIVLDRLREAAEKYHLTYAPDPATHSRCTLGGMIGNNSCGTHGLMAGKVSDNVEALELVLYDGTRLTVGRTSPEELERLSQAEGRVGEIYRGIAKLRMRYAELIRQRFPKIPRRVSGYNLDELLDENGCNIARALVGTEGTCATIVSATLNLAQSPPCRVLTALGFGDGYLAADAVPRALEYKPIGLEGFDGLLIEFMERKGINGENLPLLPEGNGYLLVEMGAWSEEEARAQAEALVAAVSDWPEKPTAKIYYDKQDAAKVWQVRESALGATAYVPGEPERWEGWDDSGIPPEHLGAYLRKLNALMAEYGYRSPLYGHFGQGCVHLRINFDFRSEKGLADFRSFLDRAADLALSYGGSLSGEHGDGQARGALLPKMFGPELIEAFREFKALWDPTNRMNPGKLIDPVRVYDPVENLRYGPEKGASTSTHEHTKMNTHFLFTKDGGSLERAAERCVGVGACRKTEGGVMCPSYRATGEEQNSTRGRARLLWEMLAGALRKEGLRSKAVYEALDLCLSCKSCKSECPVQVDMTMYKAEYLAQRYKNRPHPIHHYVFGFADKWARLGGLTPALTNAVLSGGATSPLIKHLVGIAEEREMPQLAPKSFRDLHFSRKSVKGGAQGQEVLLWADTWNNYYHPQTLEAAESVLTQAGFKVRVVKKKICCGRALYDFGLLSPAKSYLAKVLKAVEPEIKAGLPFIFLEPSCASVFKDEALEFFPEDERAKKLSAQVWLLADWLAAKAPEWVAGRLEGETIHLHGHCHHKAVFGGPVNEVELLRKAGAKVDMIQSTCCGMAGPFGFEKKKLEVSKAVAESGLLPAVRAAGPEDILVADGFSCREQIEQLGHRHALHFAEALARGKKAGC